MSELPKHVFVVILAGGSGTRFWPKSRHATPKQLCAIGDKQRTMLEQTLDRLDGFVPKDRILIVTHRDQAASTEALVGARVFGIIAEPEARNTANALGIAALEIERLAQARHLANPVMISLHADHVITHVDQFRQDLVSAIQVAERDLLTLIGIRPRYPETGFGYIERGKPLDVPGAACAFMVQSFREKPPIDLAREYVQSGRFFWNAGLFVWRNAILLQELEQRLPTTLTTLRSVKRADDGSFVGADTHSLAAAYKVLPKISIDNAVLETSTRVAVLETDFGWQDVGSWDALAQCFPADAAGNIHYGDSVLLDCKGTTVDTDGFFVAGLGLTDMVVVVAKGAVLVCPKDRAQDVKDIVAYLKKHQRFELT